MYSDTLKPNISTLRESVIVVLSQAQSLMNYANQELVTLNSYAQHAKSIENEITKVKNLELRMAIVAPMKAGKSTIINAIVGQDILPSRQQAMTTLPTEIVFSKEVTEAKLMLRHEGSDAFDVLKQSWGSLKRKINQIGLEQAKERTKAYPHLQDLLEDVSDNPESSLTSELSETEAVQPDLGEDVSNNPEPSFTPEVSGTEAIQTTLAKVNDLVRLCSALEPSDNPLMSLVSAPRIEVPFCQTESSLKLDGVGKLVFVDTLGLNEAGDMNLADVVKRQLESSAIILLVLDYTQLTTEAAEKVKRDVDEVAEIKGRESIYILINKVDMRKKKEDMTKQQVLEFVNNKFGIEASTNRVFEISASRAAYASNFWNEKKKGFTNPQDMRTSDLLGMQYYGDSWRKKFQKKVDMDDMEEAATDVWSESGFAEFLQKAIAALMIKAAPLTLLNALNDVRYGLTSLQNSINFQKNIFGQDVQKLQGQISALEHDLENLLDCQNKLKSQVKDIGKTLEQELITSLHNMKEQSSAELNNIFISREFSEAGLGKKFGRGILDMIQWFSNVKYQEAGLIEFNSQAEVDSFIEGVTASIRTITNN
ncbi:MAG: dynamin family protein, partial [Pseudanabaena sp.]